MQTKNCWILFRRKANKLDQFYDHIINGEVYLKLENVEDEANKITEIKLMIPGNQLFAKEQCKTFEEATDLAIMKACASKLKNIKLKNQLPPKLPKRLFWLLQSRNISK